MTPYEHLYMCYLVKELYDLLDHIFFSFCEVDQWSLGNNSNAIGGKQIKGTSATELLLVMFGMNNYQLARQKAPPTLYKNIRNSQKLLAFLS